MFFNSHVTYLCCQFIKMSSHCFLLVFITLKMLSFPEFFQFRKQTIVRGGKVRAVGSMIENCFVFFSFIVIKKQNATKQAPLAILSGSWQFFNISQYVSAFVVASWSVHSTRNGPFQSQKTVAITFRSENVCLNIVVCMGSVIEQTDIYSQG